MGIERVLIAEDNAQGRDFLHHTLTDKGYEVEVHGEGDAALAATMKNEFDLILVSENLPGISGIMFLERVKDLDPSTPVILLTDNNSYDTMVLAHKAGAEDCFIRPFDADRLHVMLEKLRAHHRVLQENSYLRSQFRTDEGPDVLVGESGAIRDVIEAGHNLGRTRKPVLVSGESGTGKETVARMIHFEGELAMGPFIKVKCTGLPEALLESEIFGHERGAYPGAHRKCEGRLELAHGGTLVLEGIGEIPINLQAKLNRFLEEGRFQRVGGSRTLNVEVRIIGLTTRDLARESEAGSFRQDLYEQFGSESLHIPPLRERSEDVMMLVSHFINRFRQANNSRVRSMSLEARELLIHYFWPGNVQELRNLVQRLVVLNAGEEIIPDHLPPEITGAQISRNDPFASVVGMSIHEVEREMILKTLEETGNNKTAAAKILGLTARTLHNKLKLYREQGIIAKDAYRPLRKNVEVPSSIQDRQAHQLT